MSISNDAVGVPEGSSVPSRSSGSRDRVHVASLDRLRGIAILAVLFRHAGVPLFDLGWLGVDLFFMLSGFLITSLLLREYQKTGAVRLSGFWARRFLRLMPAYWLYVGGVTLLLYYSGKPFVSQCGYSPGMLVASMWLYFRNYLPVIGFSEWIPLTTHLWSLCVEEQFYLIWPLLFLLALNRSVGWRLPASLAVGTFCYRLMIYDHANAITLRFHLETRGFAMAMGCMAAMLFWPGTVDPARLPDWIKSLTFRRWLVALTLLLLVVAVGLDKHSERAGDWVVKWLTPLFVVLFTLLVSCLWYGRTDSISRFLSWRPLVYLGTISYGVYLYHMAAHILVWDLLLVDLDALSQYPRFAARLSLYLALSLGLAVVSYHFYETPFLKLKERFRY